MDVNREALELLREVYDPELGINVVDLGLIHELRIEDGVLHLVMTLTSPGCPLADSIEVGVRQMLSLLPGVEDIDLQIVWDPPWTPERISREALATLGWRA